jgi:hypothetical protein
MGSVGNEVVNLSSLGELNFKTYLKRVILIGL